MDDYKKFITIFSNGGIVTIEEILEKSGFSERKARTYLRHCRAIGKYNGFEITTLHTQGYLFRVFDEALFDTYMHDFDEKDGRISMPLEQRIFSICTQIIMRSTNALLDSDYITYDEIAQFSGISRSDVVADMPEVKKTLARFKLKLTSKQYFGVTVVGDEYDKRDALRVAMENGVPVGDFSPETDIHLKGIVRTVLIRNELTFHRTAVDIITNLVKVTLLRRQGEQVITSTMVNMLLLDYRCEAAATEIFNEIGKEVEFTYTPLERNLMAWLIYTLISTKDTPDADVSSLKYHNSEALRVVDMTFNTNYRYETELRKHLLQQVYDLKHQPRSTQNSDTVIQDLSLSSTYTSLVAITFIRNNPILNRLNLTKVEVQNIIMFFYSTMASYRKKLRDKVKHILIASNSVISHKLYLQSKLETIFPSATIHISMGSYIEYNDLKDFDLIITTEHLYIDTTIPTFAITSLPDETLFRHIKNDVIFFKEFSQLNDLRLRDIITEDTVSFDSTKYESYESLIAHYGALIFEQGYTSQNPTDSILAHDEYVSSGYSNTAIVTAPIDPMTTESSIHMIFLEHPVMYEEELYSHVFIVNIKVDQFFLYQELFEFLSELARYRHILNAKSYKEFRMYAQDML
ncbi:hypothetical protein G7062_05070 [Erysipelothrix sp. HDW6C]|uniref:helix-turn-helix domain-containing protein n=1 Tax=Erysipelothrix sp. HDW6C TaxID=2714930 RepID=UPI001408B153|nr:helix-turn-helix domain-containing protein [Erysipelothrix sp. HDW6C]QIK69704.1 hypothetical protein G7062_05070 [Erysipelothrix sp. HDW6C]